MPTFLYSNPTSMSLDPEVLEERLSTGWGEAPNSYECIPYPQENKDTAFSSAKYIVYPIYKFERSI